MRCVVTILARCIKSQLTHLLLSSSVAVAVQIEWVSYTHTLKELALNVNTQQAITKDNVTIHISGVLYIRIVDPFRASYGVDQPLYAVMQLAQTSMRSELGKMTLDNTFEERDSLNEKLVRVCQQLQCCHTQFLHCHGH
jgi:regulator of protease activity HflC (stomatin/prohibitin superfamily)